MLDQKGNLSNKKWIVLDFNLVVKFIFTHLGSVSVMDKAVNLLSSDEEEKDVSYEHYLQVLHNL